MDENKLIQGLWVGDRLSVMEKLSIASFIQNGHIYHLYVYEELQGVPRGAILKDADELVSRERIFKCKEFGSYAGFADMFRYKLLLEKGEWWADTDVICLRPFDFKSEYAFAPERMQDGSKSINNAVIKAPVGCELMQFCYEKCSRWDPARLMWGDGGPTVFTEAVERCGLTDYLLPYGTFYPVDWWIWKDVISGEPTTRIQTRSKLTKEVYAVHLWNEMWRREGIDKNAVYHPQCLYEDLKRMYLRSDGET